MSHLILENCSMPLYIHMVGASFYSITYTSVDFDIRKEFTFWRKWLELKEDLMSRDYQRPGNVANLVETHPEFSLVRREMIFRNCIDRTMITHFHLQIVSSHRVIEQLAFSAPLTQFMFLYVNNSQSTFPRYLPQPCIICSCVCNASAW